MFYCAHQTCTSCTAFQAQPGDSAGQDAGGRHAARAARASVRHQRAGESAEQDASARLCARACLGQAAVTTLLATTKKHAARQRSAALTSSPRRDAESAGQRALFAAPLPSPLWLPSSLLPFSPSWHAMEFYSIVALVATVSHHRPFPANNFTTRPPPPTSATAAPRHLPPPPPSLPPASPHLRYCRPSPPPLPVPPPPTLPSPPLLPLPPPPPPAATCHLPPGPGRQHRQQRRHGARPRHHGAGPGPTAGGRAARRLLVLHRG